MCLLFVCCSLAHLGHFSFVLVHTEEQYLLFTFAKLPSLIHWIQSVEPAITNLFGSFYSSYLLAWNWFGNPGPFWWVMMRLDPVENEPVIFYWPLEAWFGVIRRINTAFEALNHFVAFCIRVKTEAGAMKTVIVAVKTVTLAVKTVFGAVVFIWINLFVFENLEQILITLIWKVLRSLAMTAFFLVINWR